MIGAGEAAQENLKEQYLREAMNAVLKGTEIRLYEGEQAETLRKLRQEYMVIQADYADLQDGAKKTGKIDESELIALGERSDALKSKLEALAEGAFDASGEMQEVRDVELELISAIRENTLALGEAAAHGALTALLTLPVKNGAFRTAVLYQGVGCSVAAFFLSNAAIAKIGVNKTSSFIGVSTIVSILAGALALGEPLHIGQIVGAAVIVAGVYTANRA